MLFALLVQLCSGSGKLETLGVAAADVKKLQEAGYHTAESIAYSTLKVCVKMVTRVSLLVLLSATALFVFAATGAHQGHQRSEGAEIAIRGQQTS